MSAFEVGLELLSTVPVVMTSVGLALLFRVTQRQNAGEYAFEYLKRLSPKWRVFASIEGTQVDEVELITEVQWHPHRRAFLKMNNGLGLTTNATASRRRSA